MFKNRLKIIFMLSLMAMGTLFSASSDQILVQNLLGQRSLMSAQFLLDGKPLSDYFHQDFCRLCQNFVLTPEEKFDHIAHGHFGWQFVTPCHCNFVFTSRALVKVHMQAHQLYSAHVIPDMTPAVPRTVASGEAYAVGGVSNATQTLAAPAPIVSRVSSSKRGKCRVGGWRNHRIQYSEGDEIKEFTGRVDDFLRRKGCFNRLPQNAPFNCPESDCTESFKRRANLKDHVVVKHLNGKFLDGDGNFADSRATINKRETRKREQGANRQSLQVDSEEAYAVGVSNAPQTCATSAPIVSRVTAPRGDKYGGDGWGVFQIRYIEDGETKGFTGKIDDFLEEKKWLDRLPQDVPFNCPVSGCSEIFKRRNDLKDHVVVEHLNGIFVDEDGIIARSRHTLNKRESRKRNKREQEANRQSLQDHSGEACAVEVSNPEGTDDYKADGWGACKIRYTEDGETKTFNGRVNSFLKEKGWLDHLPEKAPFNCPADGCPKIFKRRDDLKDHVVAKHLNGMFVDEDGGEATSRNTRNNRKRLNRQKRTRAAEMLLALTQAPQAVGQPQKKARKKSATKAKKGPAKVTHYCFKKDDETIRGTARDVSEVDPPLGDDGKYHCPYEGCDKSYTKMDKLRKHDIIHHLKYCLVCEECDEKFGLFYAYDNHRKECSGKGGADAVESGSNEPEPLGEDVGFRCSMCEGLVFKCIDDLIDHEEEMH